MTLRTISVTTPRILAAIGKPVRTRSGRFVTQSYALGAPIASPRLLLVAAVIAIAVFFVGWRLSD